ncbi:MAG: NAD(P)-dependent oxidoreductase [Lachnospiraceae bacterium]|nr:NAD(P)-dependent oxidoreductase [Lachnospiraceae bacterium]
MTHRGRYLEAKNKEKQEYEIFAPTSAELDCIDEEKVTAYLKEHRFDLVLNFAVYAKQADNDRDASKELEYNLRIFHNFAKNSSYYGRMFFTGSGAEYDKRRDIHLAREEDVGESIPVSAYGLMKYTINEIIEKSDNIYNLRVWGLYGKYEYYPTKFISNICCKTIKGLPLSIRQNVYFEYLYINDFLRILDILMHKELKYHSYNMANGKPIDLITLCGIVKKVSGKDTGLFVCKEGLAKEYTASNERLLTEIGQDFSYTPQEDAIRELYDWYNKNEADIDIYKLIY